MILKHPFRLLPLFVFIYFVDHSSLDATLIFSSDVLIEDVSLSESFIVAVLAYALCNLSLDFLLLLQIKV
jgi:hypothetical protein